MRLSVLAGLLGLLYFSLSLAYVHMNVTLFDPHRAFGKRDSVNAKTQNRDFYYVTEFKVGSREDTVRLLIDTRISSFWFPTIGCTPSSFYRRDSVHSYYECDSQGTYDPQFLDSFQNLSTPYEIELVSSIRSSGYLAKDTVQLGSYNDIMEFGVAESANVIGILGLGFPDSILNVNLTADLNSNLNSFSNSSLLLPSFLKQLVKRNVIFSNTYAFLLGPNNASEGQLLFGAVDHARYSGALQKLPMLSLYTSHSQKEIAVRLDGFLGEGWNTKVDLGALIVLSSTFLSFPLEILEDLAYKTNAKKEDDGFYYYDCDVLKKHDLVSFYFGGIQIEVPLRDLIKQIINLCYLLFNVGDGPIRLGQDVLQSAYVVVDLDNEEVALAQAVANPEGVDIEEITSTIPLALEAPLYSYTSVHGLYSVSLLFWSTTTFEVSAPIYSTNTRKRSVDHGGTEYDATVSGGGVGCRGILRLVISVLWLLQMV